MSSVAFFLKIVSYDLEKSLAAVFQIAGYTCAIYVHVVLLFTRQKVAALFDDLLGICRKRKCINP